MRWLPLLLLAGCGGANPETLVDELRVMAMVFEPPEVGPGEESTLTTYIAPGETGADAVSWTCTSLGEGCLEAELDGSRVVRTREAAPTTEMVMEAPLALAGILGEELPSLPVSGWTLACEPGLCDADPTEEELENPTEWMKQLPLEGTSLARKGLTVSTRPVEERLQNPTLLPDFTDFPEDGVLSFSVTVAEDAQGFGYSTAGGFDMVGGDVADGKLTLTWVPPEEEVEGEVVYWVVLNDSGGTAVWTTRVSGE